MSARILYLQTDNIFPYIVLAPTIVAGKITLGAMNQILNAFEQVRSSFQYLVNSWTTIVELLSIYKRLRAFEATIEASRCPKSTGASWKGGDGRGGRTCGLMAWGLLSRLPARSPARGKRRVAGDVVAVADAGDVGLCRLLRRSVPARANRRRRSSG